MEHPLGWTNPYQKPNNFLKNPYRIEARTMLRRGRWGYDPHGVYGYQQGSSFPKPGPLRSVANLAAGRSHWWPEDQLMLWRRAMLWSVPIYELALKAHTNHLTCEEGDAMTRYLVLVRDGAL